MEKKIKETIRRCKNLNKKTFRSPLLEELVTTQINGGFLEEFKMSPKRRRRLIAFQAELAKKEKVKQEKEELPQLYPIVPRLNTSHQDCYNFAEECPQIPMSRFQEYDVRKMVNARGLEKKYPEVIDKIMLDARDEFLSITHHAGVNLKVKPVEGEGNVQVEPLRYFGRTQYYDKFLKNRRIMLNRWFLHHKLLRKVLATCVTFLPELLFDIGAYTNYDPIDIAELNRKFTDHLIHGRKVLEDLYKKVLILIDKNQPFPSYILPACSGLVAVYFSETIMRTVDRIVQVSSDPYSIPYMKLTLSFSGGLKIKPTVNDVIGLYTIFLQDLVSLENYFTAFEETDSFNFDSQTISLNITTEYMNKSFTKLTENIGRLYSPIFDYIEMVDREFGSIYTQFGEDNLSEALTFEIGCEQIESYLSYLKKANDILRNEYFPLGELAITEYMHVLKTSLFKNIDSIFVEISNIQQAENLEICEAFDEISRKAQTVPQTTKELIEQGQYMIEVKTIQLKQIEEQIKQMLKNLTRIIDYGDLTPRHIELNATTVNWLQNIEPILEANSIMYEQLRYEAEERLQQTIKEANASLANLEPFLIVLDYMDDCENAREYLQKINIHMVALRDIQKKINWIRQEEADLNFTVSAFKQFDDLTNHIYPFYHLLKICLDIKRKILVWLDGQFEYLNAEDAEMQLEDYQKELLKNQKTYRVKIKQAQTEEGTYRFDGIVDDAELNNWPSPLKLTSRAIKKIRDFRPALTMMRVMCNDALLKRHWKEMSDVAGFNLTPDAGTTLRKLMEMGLEKDIDMYDVISAGATKERELLRTLRKMQEEWKDIVFKTSVYKDTGIMILSQLDDVQVFLDDHILKTLTMRGSVFVKPYEAEVGVFYEKLMRINNTIDVWGKVQSQWLYLLPIFSSKDIVNQMPEEGLLFREVNDTYTRYMNVVVRDPRVREAAGALGVLEDMQHCIDLLEKINDGVTNYLEKKRLFFPRFFFLSNDEMLEILSETKDPLRVQPHLKKCFEAVSRLLFDSDLQISAMYSQENEKVNLVQIIKTKESGGSVEKWLLQVEEQMLLSVRDQIFQSFNHYVTLPRTEWVQHWPGQVVLAVSQIYWTTIVHDSLNHIKGMTIEKFSSSLKEQLIDIVALIRDPRLTTLSRITIKALIVIDVHAKDVVQELVHEKVRHDREFKWLSQLRYYWEEEQCLVRLVNATVKYAYEYLGNTDRLVITPLTDRCYRTLIGAYHLHLNGAPEGPAGTGKTETTKDLAKAIAVQCVVFNCSDGLDYKAMGKFFKGLAACGAWACFDEFNRIDIEVLSVVAQQILSIILAVRAHASKFIFEGTELRLNPACYVCITMNPGYAGRSELPDNLKVLFRTVAMMVPDYAMIGEISLYSYGFMDARNLSVKIVTVYRLCSEQLSSQNHYDYGMRAVKSVLSAAGNNKRNFPDQHEDILLLRAILDVNLPKFLNHDIPLFEGIISDLFPGVVLPQADYKTFIDAVVRCCSKRNLQSKASFITKIIQTYEMMIVRWGFMIVGGPFAGKTSTLRILADTLTLLRSEGKGENRVVYQTLNPKALTMGQLYGQFDPISYEWSDGVVATCFRRYCTDSKDDRKWMIFDGPVDAVWIENMNSVLDDNKKLCLMSGEVMTLTSSMSLIFEVMDLEQASPATVSRCGMIYMEPVTLGWKPFLASWIVTCNPEWCNAYKQMILDLFNWLVPPSLIFIRKHCVQYCIVSDISLAKNLMQLVEMMLDDSCAEMVKKEEETKSLKIWVEATFIQAGIWGLGSVLDTDSRVKFDVFFKNLWRGLDEDYPIPEALDKIELAMPQEGLLFEYFYQFRMKGVWKYGPEISKGERVDECKNIMQALVPTIDTTRYMRILERHIKHQKRVLLVGPTGTGKSFYIQDLLMNKLSNEIYEPGFITFTTTISANQTQDLVISKLFKKKRGVYGPPKGKKGVLFIDDINMPVKETYGAQPPIELLRQFFDHKNWYDLKTTEAIYLQDVTFIGAMGLVGGSRQEIYERFLRHFSIFSINEFSEETMSKIYSNILLLGWKNNGFPIDILPTVNQVVAASLEIYKEAMANLRPTPSKSHYVFNLRDFSRLIQGCAMLRKETVEERTVFAKIWVHESFRIFYDRLIEEKDKAWFFSQIKGMVRNHFKEHFDQLFDDMPKINGEITRDSLKRLMFGTYFDQDSDEDRRYEQVVNLQSLLDVCRTCLDEYNSSHKTKMDIVLFDYALEHLSKICRVISMSCGCALLVGISGSGRQSLTRLAAEIYSQPLFQPEITNNYGLNEWRDDIKRILKEAGGKGKHCIFLLGEGQIKEETFLQDIDGLLNSGEVPNIYQIDEKQEILDMVRLAAQGGNRNLDVSALSVFFYFTKRCRDKLHIILCFSPVGSTFRNRLRLFPSLINCCTIDWFNDWPETALEEVAYSWMADVNLDQSIKNGAVECCKYFHVQARNISDEFFRTLGRKTYITSASYLELIKSFTILTNTKQEAIMKAKKRYLGGLEKLQFAAEQIKEMQRSLGELQPQLEKMNEAAIKMMMKIETETVQVEKASDLVKQDEKVANKQAAAAQALKNECEADLAEAIPVLDDALRALDTLKPADITLVKSMKNPPAIIKLVMAAVCIIKGLKPNRVPDPSTGRMLLDFWGPSQRVLGDMNLLQNLKEFDKNNIPADHMVKIRKDYIPHPDFKPQLVAKASSAAEGLCKWIIAMDKYDQVIKVVAPKKAKLAQAESELAATIEILREKKAQVAKLEEALAELQEKLAEAQAKQAELQDQVELCRNKLIRAQKIIGGLGGERMRWTEAANALQAQYNNLAGDILVSSGIMSYLAPFTSGLRQQCIVDWHKYVKRLNIPTGNEYNFNDTLGLDVKLQNWYIAGLPRDSFSTENAVIQDNSLKFSLFIDPQYQASNWIKKMEKKNSLNVVKFSHDYMKKIEVCVQMGYPVLIEGIGEVLEAPIDPLLYKKTFKQAGVEVIALGESVIQYNKSFHLYLTSQLRNPHYLPEVFNKVTIINFALTLEGLQDQLLGIVVAVEKPELQRLKEELIQEKADNREALGEVEKNILRTLSECQGDILEDESAIQILDESKVLAINIMEKQEKSLETEKTIEEFRDLYKGVSAHSAVLYYCIADLANVDPMYQYSLEWFINLYISSIQRAEKSKNITQRCASLITAFTFDLYSNITRSLFEKDKLLFSFLLCSKIMIFEKKLDESDFIFLLTGGVNVDNALKNPTDWLPKNSWDEVCRVNTLPPFARFKDEFVRNPNAWKAIYDAYEPETCALPAPWNESLNSFRKLIVIRLFRPDKLLVASTNFVKKEMGVKFISPPQFNIAVSYNESYCLCPLIFILSPGTDPMSSLAKFAEERQVVEKFHSISLGQGQGPRAQFLIEQGQEEGLWVCLQNCHLATSWMSSLEKIFENLDYSNTHENFRLWLTSYPSDKFPVAILQKSVKMTNEPPTGLRENLLKSYLNEPVKSPEFYLGCAGNEEVFAKLLFGIAFFHAVVQERRTFGALGWNIPYGFNESDFDISVQQLQMFINESENPYEALTYLIGECNYGGRVTDDWDRRLIVTILADFLNPQVVSNTNYKFCDISDIYGLPLKLDYKSFVNHIQGLPQLHPPQVFGLHTNAGITRDLQNSNLLLSSVLKAYGESQGGVAGETEKLLTMLCADLLGKIPKEFDLEKAQKRYPIEYSESMNTVLVQEMQRFNRLLKTITNTLVTMQKAIEGLVAMSPNLEAFGTSLILSRIPASWAGVSYPSLKNLPNYISDFVQRLAFLQEWFNSGKPINYWISGFFFTQAFLTGVKQNYARKYTIPIDKLTFDFEVLTVEKCNKATADGAYVYGLFTDGARWDRSKGQIAELLPKVLHDTMPVIWVKPIRMEQYSEGVRYKSPVYKTSARRGVLSTTGHSTNYVLPILLNTNLKPSHWIKRSMALLCQLD